MGQSKIPWLAAASNRLQLLHIEIDAAVRHAAWDEEFEDEHISAFMQAIIEAERIQTDIIKYVSEERRRRADRNSAQSLERRNMTLQRIAAHNGNGHVNGKG